jgi:FMN-dependent NADH-azoreductase
LSATPPPLIDAHWIGAAYTDEAVRSEEQRESLALSDESIAELEKADEYVIGVAMHNFGIPAVLRLWIDEIVRRGKTFSYGAEGPRGLLSGKRATIVVASGGVYTPGSPAALMDHVEPYLRTVLGFIGVSDVRFIWAGGTAKLMMGAVERDEFLRPFLEEVREAVG